MKENLTYEKRKKALRYLMFLKEKHDRTIKAHGCANGRPQWQYTSKDEVKFAIRIPRGNDAVMCYRCKRG